MKLILILFCFVLFGVACNSNQTASTKIDTLNKVKGVVSKASFLGNWKVLSISETTFDMNDGEVLKGPFKNSPNNATILFSKDSFIYKEGEKGHDEYIESFYTYSTLNDSILQVKNVSSGDTMRFTFQQITEKSLTVKNVRKEESRRNRYEVIIECSKQ